MRFMAQKKAPECGDWLKLVECAALKRHGEYGEEVIQGDFFRFLGLSAAEGYGECYSPRLKSRFWMRLDYLMPIRDLDLIFLLELEVPSEFKRPISSPAYSESQSCFAVQFQQKTKET